MIGLKQVSDLNLNIPQQKSMSNFFGNPGSGQSLKRLLEPDDVDAEDNPKLKQRLKENAVTMNKMAELRTQMENLSMLKKTKRKVTKKRPKSGRRSNGPSRYVFTI